MVPLAVGVIAHRTKLDGVRSVSATTAVQVNPQAVIVVEIELKILYVGDRSEFERVHTIRAGGARPEVESEFVCPKVPISAVRYRDRVVCPVESKRLTNFAAGKGRAVYGPIVIALTVGRVAFALPPCDHPSGRRRAGRRNDEGILSSRRRDAAARNDGRLAASIALDAYAVIRTARLDIAVDEINPALTLIEPDLEIHDRRANTATVLRPPLDVEDAIRCRTADRGENTLTVRCIERV